MRKKLFLPLFLVMSIWTFGSFWSWLFPSMEEGMIVGGKIDTVNPVISPDAHYTLYTYMDGSKNPLVLIDNVKKRKRLFSSTTKSMNMKGTTIFMEPRWDVNSKEFVYTDVANMKVIHASLEKVLNELGYENQKSLMPDINSGEIIFVSSYNRLFSLIKWSEGNYEKILSDGKFKIYPRFLNNKVLYIQYNLGETALMIYDGENAKEISLGKGYQISRIYPCHCGKVLVVANKDKYREDIFLYNMKKGILKKLDEDIVGNTVFWLNSDSYGYVKKKNRDTVIIVQENGEKKRKILVKGHPIEWVSASKKRWIAAAIFDPENVVTNIFLFKLEDR